MTYTSVSDITQHYITTQPATKKKKRKVVAVEMVPQNTLDVNLFLVLCAAASHLKYQLEQQSSSHYFQI